MSTHAYPAIPVTLRRARVGVSTAYALQGFNTAVLATILPGMTARQSISAGEVALLTLTIALFAAAGSLLAGTWAKQRGSGSIVVPGLLLQAAMLALVIINFPLPALFPIYAIYGIGVGIVDAGNGMQAITVQHAYGKSIINLFFAFQSIAIIAAALVVAAITGSGLPFEFALAVTVAAGIMVCFVLPGRFAPDPEAELIEKKSAVNLPKLPWKGTVIFGLVIAAAYIGDSAVSTWSTVYLGNTLQSPTFLAPLGFAGYQATTLIARLLGDHLVRTLGRVRVVAIAITISVAGFVTVAFAPTPLIAVTVFALLGFGVGVLVPLSFSAAGDLAPDRVDEIVARLNLFNYLGAIVGAVAVGLIADATSLHVAYLLPAVLIVPAYLALGAYRRRHAAVRPTHTVLVAVDTTWR